MPDHARPRAIESIAWAAASLSMAGAAAFLALHHPLWPTAVPVLLAAWMFIVYRVPRAWLFALPAGLPALNLAPWTGWIGIDEFDLFVLATVAAGYARVARDAGWGPPPMPRLPFVVALAVAGLTLAQLWRGVVDAGGWDFGWFQGYTEPLNSLRVAKSFLQALLLLPLVRREWHADAALAFRRFAQGMWAGAGLVILAVLWERAALPGLFNISSPYRTVALFWEMHVGGAAIDAYVVLCSPFVVWSLWAARGKWQWLAAALTAILWGYVGLTTFSRGAYFGVAVALLVLGLLLPIAQGPRWWPVARAMAFMLGAALLLVLVLDGWGYGAAALALVALGAALWLRWRGHATRRHRALAAGMLVLALLFELAVMLGPDSFMSSRMARSAVDYESRTLHWRRGVGLLQGADAWLFGLGPGRLPAHYDRFAARGEFAGGVQWLAAGEDVGSVRLLGPRSRPSLGGRYGLTQRVALGAGYRLRFDARAEGDAVLLVRVCESHLLYDRACQVAVSRIVSSPVGEWQSRELVLRGPVLEPGPWYAPRQGVLTLSVLNAGGAVELDRLVLQSSSGQPLQNGDFSAGMAHWWPAAQTYFVPWHIDNLFLELLIERGAVGALALLALTGAVLLRLLRQPDPGNDGAPFVAASLCAVLSLGLVSSVLDVPRVALLLALLLVVGALAVK